MADPSNPYPYRSDVWDHDKEGFFKPSSFGFPEEVDTSLKMSMFPLCKYDFEKIALSSHEVAKRNSMKAVLQMPEIEKMLIIPKSREAGMTFANMYRLKTMVTSLGSPPLPDEIDYNMDEEYFTYGKETKTIHQWIQKYFVGQIVNTFLYYYFTSKVDDRLYPAIISFLDVTEGTLLNESFDVIEILTIVKEARIPFSLLESDRSKADAYDVFYKIIDIFIERILSVHGEKKYSEKLWLIFVMLSIKICQYYEKPYILQSQGGEHVADEDYTYRLRFYLTKRRGRLVHRPTEIFVPEEMLAPAGEEDLSESMWLAMSQYYRLLTLVQYGHNLPIFNTYVSAPQSFIFRDAHACSTSSISAEYDSIFYYEVYRAAHNRASRMEKEIMMIGINPAYKMKRHSRVQTYNSSWIVPPLDDTLYSPHTLGVLAGICWFYNPNIDNPLFGPYYDSILLLPFLKLDSKLPMFSSEEEKANVLSLMPNFFTYGVDEYILSKLVNDYVANEETREEMNILFFTIHWIQAFCGSAITSEYEYYPLTSQMVYNEIARTSSERRSFGKFVRGKFVDNGLKYTFIHTMFGNIENNYLNDIPANEIITPPSPDDFNKSSYAFAEQFPSLVTGTTREGVPILNMSCLLDYLHRYDRPYYWISTGRRNDKGNWLSMFSPRTYTDGRPIIPNNRSKEPGRDLNFVINNQLTDLTSCITGTNCPDNTDRGMMGLCIDDSGRGRNTWGGYRKQTRKIKKKKGKRKQTRKHKA